MESTPPPSTPRLDLAAVRERLRDRRGAAFWRSLEEIAETPAFEDFLHREFPRQASEWPEDDRSGVDRRRFLQLSTASLALAGLTGCTRQPLEKIVPYVRAPEDIVPGRPLYYASSMTIGGYALGLLYESHMGRPTKAEGNPEHPASLGATDVWAQASVLGLYDPDRSQVVQRRGGISTWSAFVTALQQALAEQRPSGGGRIRVLTETVTSPTIATQMRRLAAALPGARWHQWEPLARDSGRLGAELAFGTKLSTRYDLRQAEVVLTLDSNFLVEGPGAVRYHRDLVATRRLRRAAGGPKQMSRFYAVESTPTATGTLADHRLPLRGSDVSRFAVALAAELGVPEVVGTVPLEGEAGRWAAAVARDLAEHQGRCVVVAGDALPPAVHALAHAMNERLGNLGSTVLVSEPVEVEPVDQLASLTELVRAMRGGEVDLLLVLGGNPVYSAPADLDFRAAYQRVPLRVHLGLHDDETAEHSHWHVPLAHELESWGDARAYDGTVSLQQPLIEPLYGGKTVTEVLQLLIGPPVAAHELVRAQFAAGYGESGATGSTIAAAVTAAAAGSEAGLGAPTDPSAPAAAPATLTAATESAWRQALHNGFVAGTALAPRSATVRRDGVARAVAALREQPVSSGLDVVFRPDPSVLDGRFANNGWLQELPKPLTKLTWDNAVLVAPSTAERLGLADEDLVALTVGDAMLELPVWVLPGQGPETLTVFLGYGRQRTGRIGSGLGFDTYRLRTTAAPWLATGARLERTGRRYELASTQQHHMLETQNLEGREAEKRDLVRVGTVAEWRRDPNFAQYGPHATAEPPVGDAHAPNVSPAGAGGYGEGSQADEGGEHESVSMYPPWSYPEHAWGMAIDLASCTGCNACVVACQSENNIPIVGKEQVRRGREMHWLRIDRYFYGEDLDRPDVHHQPLLCMQCETAPCEVVCPVAATVHSAEGLNDMVYNRCVGTRYCSNNCPYKVRRFNFLKFNDYDTPVLDLLRNPDVTVRSRGVMEKCTYCVQRINGARIEAKKQNRRVRDGEIQTACQQACPGEAIVFGDINDATSRVAQLKAEPTNYGLLEELDTRPRTTYLAKIRNPNPLLGGGAAARPENEA